MQYLLTTTSGPTPTPLKDTDFLVEAQGDHLQPPHSRVSYIGWCYPGNQSLSALCLVMAGRYRLWPRWIGGGSSREKNV